MLHRRRTMASCRWLCIAPQRTLAGCGYTLELSRDPRFPEVPAAPGFPLQPSCITACSSAYVCGTGYALPIRPPGRPCPTFTRNQVTPAFPPMRRFTVAQLLYTLLPVVDWSSLCNRSGRAIGSKGGVAPPSAQRSRTSPIRGMRLQRLLGTGLGNPVPVGLANRRAFRQCVFAVGGLP